MIFKKKRLYAGWLYANKEELEKLKELGVYGPMNWTPDSGSITRALGKSGNVSYCLCNEETHKKLQDYYEELWRTKYPHYHLLSLDSLAYPSFSKITEKEAKQMIAEWEDES